MIAQKLKKRKEALDQMRALVDKAKREKRDLTNSEFQAFNDLETELKKIDFAIAPDEVYKNYTSRQLLEAAVELREEKNHEAANLLFWLYANKKAQVFHESAKFDEELLQYPERLLKGEPFNPEKVAKEAKPDELFVYGASLNIY